ncbi:unnamed protein product [Rotaria sp. Silwood1]|nr:unnamed protein product [Rotaria sp. Silwood1]
MAESLNTSELCPSFGEQRESTSLSDDIKKSITNEIICILQIDDNENKDEIVNNLLENGRHSLIKYKEDIISKIYKEVMNGNDNKLMMLLQKYFQQQCEIQYGKSNQWFISFLEQYRIGENHDIYERLLTRTAEYGNTYMKNCPILSITLQLLFEGIDDECLKKTNVFNDLWFTITNGGLKSITQYSDYIIKNVMNEQLKSQSILFQALREYYRQNVFSSLKQSNIVEKGNLYELVLDDVAKHGWLTDLKPIQDLITPRSYNRLLEKLHSFYTKQAQPTNEKKNMTDVRSTEVNLKSEPRSTATDTKAEKKQGNLNLIESFSIIFHSIYLWYIEEADGQINFIVR